MIKFLNIVIKLLIIKLILEQLFHIILFIRNEIRYFEDIFVFLQQLIPIILSMLLFYFVWTNVNKISKKIAGGEIEIENAVNVNYKDVLSVIIIAIGFNFIVINTASLINSFISILIIQFRNFDKERMEYINYTILTDIIESVMGIIISVLLIVFRKRIIKICD